MAARIAVPGPQAAAYYPTMPSDTFLQLMNRTHRILIAASGGSARRSFSVMHVVELTTTGRKRGQLRWPLLTSRDQEERRAYIVASRGGDDHTPAAVNN